MERAASVRQDGPVRHAGGCHCGRVRIEVLAPSGLDGLECNCSMCSRSAYLHLIVAADDFRLVSGAGDLVEYRFG
ncbi:MAG: GFA family protein, partial [Steroidobacteraceae bacterium]